MTPAALAALGIGAALLLAIAMHVMEKPQSIRAGRGQAVLVLWPGDPGSAVRKLARETPEEFGFDTRPLKGAKPIVLAHATAARRALRLAAKGQVRALVLVSPKAAAPAAADIAFPPAVIVEENPARVSDLMAALPTAELISAPKLGHSPQKRRPDLIAQALRRAAAMAEAPASR